MIIKPEWTKLHAFMKIHLTQTPTYKNHGTLTSWNTSPSWEVAQLVNKSQTFMEPIGSSSYSQGPTTILGHTISVYNLTIPVLLRPISYYPAIYACISQVVSSFQLFQTKLHIHFSFVLCLLHVPPIIPSLICSLKNY